MIMIAMVLGISEAISAGAVLFPSARRGMGDFQEIAMDKVSIMTGLLTLRWARQNPLAPLDGAKMTDITAPKDVSAGNQSFF
jgi:hypothetical protein